jgi:hypothetical protein
MNSSSPMQQALIDGERDSRLGNDRVVPRQYSTMDIFIYAYLRGFDSVQFRRKVA